MAIEKIYGSQESAKQHAWTALGTIIPLLVIGFGAWKALGEDVVLAADAAQRNTKQIEQLDDRLRTIEKGQAAILQHQEDAIDSQKEYRGVQRKWQEDINRRLDRIIEKLPK